MGLGMGHVGSRSLSCRRSADLLPFSVGHLLDTSNSTARPVYDGAGSTGEGLMAGMNLLLA